MQNVRLLFKQLRLQNKMILKFTLVKRYFKINKKQIQALREFKFMMSKRLNTSDYIKTYHKPPTPPKKNKCKFYFKIIINI